VKPIAIAALLALFVLAPIAEGAYDPVGSGTAKLTLDRRFARFLSQNEIKLTATKPARKKGAALLLPVTGGNLDPGTAKGEIVANGNLVFEGERGRVPLRNLTVKTKREPLIAKVGGSQLKLASSSRLSAKRQGFGLAFSAKALELSAKFVTRLNKKLRPKAPFYEGQPLGTLTAKAQPQLATVLEANRATIAFDPAFLAKLDSRFVSLNPIFPAEHGGPTFTFPIAAGGAIAPNGSQGTLRVAGSLEMLQLGAAQVFWHEPWLDLGARSESAEVDVEPTPAFPGKLGRVGIMDLGAASVISDPKARTVSVSGAPLTLGAQAAATLNEAFAQGQPPAFAAGEMVAFLSFTAQTQ
jgi:hypothetical protein